ncbi:MAG TPA: hypothetical protein VNJ04_09045, partial [Gemmatimonadaceae bacterium]|nr:hypothetical protein [Gemmatimonadaceae bacterium]
MRILAPALLMLSACTQMPAPVSSPSAATVPEAAVRPGIEVFLANVPAALRGKRVGLITNHTGIDRSRNTDIDL